MHQVLAGGAGTAPVIDLGVPIGVFFIIAAILSLVTIVRATTAGQRARRFLRGGLITLVPLGILLVLINRLSVMLPGDVPPALLRIIEYIGANPFGGRTTETFLEYQTVTLEWGMEVGGYLLVASAVLQLVASLIEMGEG